MTERRAAGRPRGVRVALCVYNRRSSETIRKPVQRREEQFDQVASRVGGTEHVLRQEQWFDQVACQVGDALRKMDLRGAFRSRGSMRNFTSAGASENLLTETTGETEDDGLRTWSNSI